MFLRFLGTPHRRLPWNRQDDIVEGSTFSMRKVVNADCFRLKQVCMELVAQVCLIALGGVDLGEARIFHCETYKLLGGSGGLDERMLAAVTEHTISPRGVKHGVEADLTQLLVVRDNQVPILSTTFRNTSWMEVDTECKSNTEQHGSRLRWGPASPARS